MDERTRIAGMLAALRAKHKDLTGLARERIAITCYELERYMEDKNKGLEAQDTIITEAINRLSFLLGQIEESQ